MCVSVEGNGWACEGGIGGYIEQSFACSSGQQGLHAYLHSKYNSVVTWQISLIAASFTLHRSTANAAINCCQNR